MNAPVAAKFFRFRISAASLLLVVARLLELVHVAGGSDPVADRRIGVVAQPARCLHDVGVGVVNESVFDVRHAGFSLTPASGT
jgi:hypothetical protein